MEDIVIVGATRTPDRQVSRRARRTPASDLGALVIRKVPSSARASSPTRSRKSSWDRLPHRRHRPERRTAGGE